MKALLQRVSEASVSVACEPLGGIGAGLLVLLCVEQGDTAAQADWLAGKVAKLRIFEDEAGKMNRALLDTGGGALVVSQFTLCADLSRGNRPGFSGAAAPEAAQALLARFCAGLRDQGIAVAEGRFGSHMAVSLINDGPVTIWLDTRQEA